MLPEHDPGRAVRSFFEDYLLQRRSASQHTVRSYRDTLKLFFAFAAANRKPVAELRIRDLDVNLVLDFLSHLEAERKNSIATRNARTGHGAQDARVCCPSGIGPELVSRLLALDMLPKHGKTKAATCTRAQLPS